MASYELRGHVSYELVSKATSRLYPFSCETCCCSAALASYALQCSTCEICFAVLHFTACGNGFCMSVLGWCVRINTVLCTLHALCLYTPCVSTRALACYFPCALACFSLLFLSHNLPLFASDNFPLFQSHGFSLHSFKATSFL